MKRIIVIIITLFLLTLPGWCDSAENMFRHLYVPSGQAPIRDMIINLDVIRKVSEVKDGPKVDMVVSQDKVFFKYPDKIRAESLINNKFHPLYGQTTTVIRDGKRWFLFASFKNWPIKYGADEHKITSRLPFRIQSYPEDSKLEYFKLGTEIENGKKIEVIGILNPDTKKVDDRVRLKKLWIDTEKWVPTKLEYNTIKKEKKNGKEDKKKEKVVKHKLVYEEPQRLPDGRWIPFIIKVHEKVGADDEKLTETVVYRQIAVNVDLDPGLFRVLERYLK